MKTKTKSLSKFQRYKSTLELISKFGDGIMPVIVDWNNIGKMAKARATEVLKDKCRSCGKFK